MDLFFFGCVHNKGEKKWEETREVQKCRLISKSKQGRNNNNKRFVPSVPAQQSF